MKDRKIYQNKLQKYVSWIYEAEKDESFQFLQFHRIQVTELF